MSYDVVQALAPHCVGSDIVKVTGRDGGQAAVLGSKLFQAFVSDHATERN
ncbi:hypothetical protein [Halocatena salina]|uniref:Uncharacterized protein n=1 Tax=Halocatena salina TaxID=2934340 RepID=A0A8U0A6N7_9EURY|nr:hypothetical protein [Halocatena salina]UPM44529.1 hypothetical protein MW046_13950 [Halocatena salina]